MIVALCLGPNAFAQAGDTTVAPATVQLAQAVARLEPQAKVRVSYLANWAEGTLLHATRDSIHVQVGATMLPLPLRVIDTMSVKRRSIGRGTIAGALIGTGVAMLAGLAFEDKKEEFGQGCDCNGFPKKAALIGLGGGAVLGAVIGSGHRHWQRIFARSYYDR
jgi:hypothetical protein